jgi:hypothetical protein
MFALICLRIPAVIVDQRHSGSNGERPTTTTGGAASDDVDPHASRDSCESPTPDCDRSTVSNSPVAGATATASDRYTPCGTTDDGSRSKGNQQRQQPQQPQQQPITTTIPPSPMASNHPDGGNRQILPQLQPPKAMSATSSSTSGRDLLPNESAAADGVGAEEAQKKCGAAVANMHQQNFDPRAPDATSSRNFYPVSGTKMAALPDDELQRVHPHGQQQLPPQQMQGVFHPVGCYGTSTAGTSGFYSQPSQQQQQQHMQQQQDAAVASWTENQLAAAAGNYFRSAPDYGYSALVGNATSSSVAGRATVEYRPNNVSHGGSRPTGTVGCQPASGFGSFGSGPATALYADVGDYSSFYGASYRTATAAAAHLYKQDF